MRERSGSFTAHLCRLPCWDPGVLFQASLHPCSPEGAEKPGKDPPCKGQVSDGHPPFGQSWAPRLEADSINTQARAPNCEQSLTLAEEPVSKSHGNHSHKRAHEVGGTLRLLPPGVAAGLPEGLRARAGACGERSGHVRGHNPGSAQVSPDLNGRSLSLQDGLQATVQAVGILLMPPLWD